MKPRSTPFVARPAPSVPDQSANWTWPDPPGGPHPCDRDALDAIERATVCAKHGDRLGCLRALADYEFLCHCGVERPDFESRVRGLYVRLGRLPAEHTVPEEVATIDELLAVFAVNQDSPQKTYRTGGGFLYSNARGGEATGCVEITWRVSSLVNYGRDRVGSPHTDNASIDGARVSWDGGVFARVEADRYGQPRTPEQQRALAEANLRLWATLLEFERRAKVYGWEMAEREDHLRVVTVNCERGGVDPTRLPEVVWPPVALPGRPHGRARVAPKKKAKPK